MIVIVMGVCGAGKTTVGEQLAERLGARFEEGDKYHPPANVEKMSIGTPLTDEDRWPWLEGIASRIDKWQSAGTSAVIACSALKESYRQILVGDRPEVYILYLKGDAATLTERMQQRDHHFMPASLLPSQLATLEEPSPSDNVIVADVRSPPQEIVETAAQILATRQSAVAQIGAAE